MSDIASQAETIRELLQSGRAACLKRGMSVEKFSIALHALEELQAVATASAEAFDITDGRNRYRPCPRCKADSGMGLVTTDGALAVQCLRCGCRGPAMSGAPAAWKDKWAFDAWNDMSRGADSPVGADPSDSEMLDWMDRRRIALNRHFGTNYGWRFVAGPNVTRALVRMNELDLHDAEANGPDIRTALRTAMKEGVGNVR